MIDCGDISTFMASIANDTIEEVSSDWNRYPLSYGDIFDSKTFNDNDTLEEASSDNLSLARALAYDER